MSWTKFLLLLFSLLFFSFAKAQQQQQSQADKIRIDSIFTAISNMKEDTVTVNYIDSVYNEYLWQFDLPEAYNKLKYAVKLASSLHYNRGELNAYNDMANYCIRAGNVDFSNENRLHALAVAERMNDSLRIAGLWVGLGLGQHTAGNPDSSLVYYFKAKPYLEKSGSKDRISRLYAFLAWSYQELHQDSIALDYALRALTIRKEIKFQDGIYASLGSVRSIYLSMHNYEKALEYSREAFDYRVKDGTDQGIALGYMGLGEVQEKMNEVDSALMNYNKALALILKVNNKIVLEDIYKHLSSALDLKGDSIAAYRYYRLHINLKDSLDKAELSVKQARTKEIYDLESKNAELELKEKDINLQRKSLWGLALILSISCVLGIIIFMNYRQKKKLAVDLSVQKKVVEEKNLDITNSIVYAKRIQQAILPSLAEIKKALPDSFVLYHPKDIVSGDFFWFTETADSHYIAAVDCTGHGVPGALMSMIGFNFLSQIVNEMRIADTAEILNTLHRKILLALNKDFSTHEVKDGMDIALLRIYKGKNEIEFSGAVRPLYIIENGNLNLIKGDIYSIGGIKDVDGESFSSHRISVSKGASLYLFSDGFADQFGGPFGKKFKYKALKELFISIHQLPMEEQKQKMNEAFEKWKGNLEQVDDVMIIGVKM